MQGAVDDLQAVPPYPLKAGSCGLDREPVHARRQISRQIDAQGRSVWLPGNYELVIGSASPGPRAQALGAPEAVRGKVVLV